MEQVSIKDIVTWVVMAGGFGGLFASHRVWMRQLQSIVFDRNGEPRLASYVALDRAMSDCRKNAKEKRDRMQCEIDATRSALEDVKLSIHSHTSTEASRLGEIVVCLEKLTEKVGILCKGVS